MAPPATQLSPGRRQSKRSVATRAGILEAACGVFTASGYAEASIADVVSRSAASVGSLYHHFSGKADLYLALFDQFSADQMEQATAAVGAARAGGETDPLRLFLAGSQAYLTSCWEGRDMARLFLDGGGPDGFEAFVRRRTEAWVKQNTALLQVDGQPGGTALVHTLTTVAGTAGREVAKCATAAGARQLTDDFLALLARIATPPSG